LLTTLTYPSAGVHRVVGQLESLERDGRQPAGRVPRARDGEGRVGVDVEAARGGRVGLAGDQPRRPVVGVAVSAGVDRRHVHDDRVARRRIQLTDETHAHRRKHATASVNQSINQSINVKFEGRRYTTRPGAPTVVSGKYAFIK